MVFRYVLADKVGWYLSRGWEIVGERMIGDWHTYIVRKYDGK